MRLFSIELFVLPLITIKPKYHFTKLEMKLFSRTQAQIIAKVRALDTSDKCHVILRARQSHMKKCSSNENEWRNASCAPCAVEMKPIAAPLNEMLNKNGNKRHKTAANRTQFKSNYFINIQAYI